MGLLSKKIKGATIIEAIVSMMIIMIVFVMFIMVYVNVMSSDNGPKKLEALSEINELLDQAHAKRLYTDTVIKVDSLTIIRSMQKINSDSNSVLIVKVIDKNGSVIAKQSEIVIK